MKALPGWTAWILRFPLWTVALALVALILYSNWRSSIFDERASAAVDAARSFAAGAKAFHGRIAADEAQEALVMQAASRQTAGFGRQMTRADSLRRADSTRADSALAAAQTAQDSITAYQRQVAGFDGVRAAWRLSADSAAGALESLGRAVSFADAARDAAVRRADSANVQIEHLLKASECRILWVIPCIKHVSVGPSLDVVSLDKSGVHVGPRQLELSVQWHLGP